MRLRYIPFSEIKLVKPDCDVKQCVESSVCQVCPTARQTGKCFPYSCIKSSKPFELVHLDIWDPYKTKTQSGCTQFVTLVDDFTKFTWVHILKLKYDVFQVMQNFVSYIDTHFSAKLLHVRSDNALELTEGNLRSFFASKGIIQQTGCPHTPQHK